MCYSAEIRAEYERYRALFGAVMSIKEYVRTFWSRREMRLQIPKAMELEVLASSDPALDEAKKAINEFNTAEATRLEQELFKQRARLVEAERKLSVKETKAALESLRIATNKVEWALGKLSDLRRTELKPRDSRIFPGWYAPVMVMEDGKLVVKPMRYQCRPAGKPAFYDTKYPGTYNARRDNLEGFWKGQFGHNHGLMLVTSFYENVNRHRAEGRELAPGEEVENLVLQFKPRPEQEMLVACLWSRWSGSAGEELLSFAAITDEPPPEVSAAGHDRCIIPIKHENVEAWLNPEGATLQAMYDIFDDRPRPYYEHRLAA
jgi:putative SOS response-associated peptidase YedK